MKNLLSTMAVFVTLSWGADVTGAWSGPLKMTNKGETRGDTAHLMLTQTGNEVKGTVGPTAEKQHPITKGSIEGADVLLEAAMPDNNGKIIIRLKLEGDKLTGDLKAEGIEGEAFTGTMDLARAK